MMTSILNLYNNGLLIQAPEVVALDFVGFDPLTPYFGIGRYQSWPLENESDTVSKELTYEAKDKWFYYTIDGNGYPPAAAPDKKYCKRYLHHCNLLGIKTRLLFFLQDT